MIEYQTPIRKTPDVKEKIPDMYDVAWLSGIFETGGSIGFSIETWPNRPNYESAYPYLSRNDSHDRTTVLKDLFGGRSQIQKINSWRWELKGPNAIETALSMDLFSPSRRSVIEMFREFDREDLMSKKVKLTKEFRQNGIRRNPVCEDEYFRLLQYPAFTAGIFDAIGTVDNAPYAPLRTQFESTNQPLLNAMRERFGGSTYIRVKPGTQVRLREAKWVTVNPSLELTLAAEKSQELLELISSHLQMNRTRVEDALNGLK
ncbi:MAG: hypothetical protein HYT08_03075 [Candidatus Levybacteria bacterium]|nr:hypothetical protein [Candidatus Levybacteria bacterium]